MNYTVPANVPAGSYLLLVRPDAGNVVNEKVESNNVAATPSAVSIAPPFADLTGAFGPVKVTGVGPKRAVTATLALQNLGNSTYSGPVTVSLLTSTDATADAGDLPLATLPAKAVKVKANGRKVLRLRALVGSLAPGTYHLVAHVASSGSPADTNAANDDVVSGGTFVVG